MRCSLTMFLRKHAHGGRGEKDVSRRSLSSPFLSGSQALSARFARGLSSIRVAPNFSFASHVLFESPFLLVAACAAASLATDTRYGEHDT